MKKVPASKPSTPPAKPARNIASPASEDPVIVDLPKEHYARLVDIARKQGVDVESLIRAVVDKHLVRLESEPEKPGATTIEIPLSTRDQASLQTLATKTGIDAKELFYKAAMSRLENTALALGDVPETPRLDSLEEPSATCYEYQLSQPDLRLPTPGLLGEVAIPQSVALRVMAGTLLDYSLDLMRLSVEKFPETRKRVADTLLLAEVIYLKSSGDKLSTVAHEGEETDCQLFARWAMTGGRFEDFESILKERAAHRDATRARARAVDQCGSPEIAA